MFIIALLTFIFVNCK
ncbi:MULTISPECIES: hypothetical protein [Lacrimispora]|nr:hypothetical protein [Lacrimispora sp.]